MALLTQSRGPWRFEPYKILLLSKDVDPHYKGWRELMNCRKHLLHICEEQCKENVFYYNFMEYHTCAIKYSISKVFAEYGDLISKSLTFELPKLSEFSIEELTQVKERSLDEFRDFPVLCLTRAQKVVWATFRNKIIKFYEDLANDIAEKADTPSFTMSYFNGVKMTSKMKATFETICKNKADEFLKGDFTMINFEEELKLLLL